MSYAGEFSDIEKTKFWSEYVDRIEKARKKVATELENGDIEEPRTLGTSLQECLRLLDSILRLPLTMIRDRE